jgi:hypothetical protein
MVGYRTARAYPLTSAGFFDRVEQQEARKIQQPKRRPQQLGDQEDRFLGAHDTRILHLGPLTYGPTLNRLG